MLPRGPVRENFERHATHRTGPSASIFTARIAAALMNVLDEDTSLGRRIIQWQGNARGDALCLRAVAAFHALKLSGREPGLVPHYPPSETDDVALAGGLRAAIALHDRFLTAFLDRPPQTNEVGRSAVILGAALHVAHKTRLPIAPREIGASAGLNMWFGAYAYDLGGGRHWGKADAPLTVQSEWTGALPPLDADLRVVDCAACDRDPLRAADPDDRLRLASYIWADQTDRLDRMMKAMAYAAAIDLPPERAEAADWVERAVSEPARPGVARMLYHSIVWQYLDPETKARISAAMQAAGERAEATTPLAWFRYEDDGVEGSAGLQLTLWPGGETRALGRADYHGRWAAWQ